jgi:murein DD-endopeptidase MepM/ murein hydrolase activator NlpD
LAAILVGCSTSGSNDVADADATFGDADATSATAGAGGASPDGAGGATGDADADADDGSAESTSLPVFQRPFPPTVDYQTTNFFDHDVPQEFVDANGKYVSYWGEDSLVGIDGHGGYDWRMDAGTAVLAVMDGVVTFAGVSAPFACPLLGMTVADQRLVVVEHALPGGVRLRTQYVHLGTIAVAVGQSVQAGQRLGAVGATGCALNPHLHFAVLRVSQTKSGQPALIDPYGWSGAFPDPWESAPEGAVSLALWKPGEAPPLFREVDLALNGGGTTMFVALTRVRFQGVDDAHNPNNELVEITRDNRFAPPTLDLTGFTLKNKAGDLFTFPAGFTLTAARTSVRVFTGTGQATETELYWGQAAGRLDNRAECVSFSNAAGMLRTRIGWGGGCQ